MSIFKMQKWADEKLGNHTLGYFLTISTFVYKSLIPIYLAVLTTFILHDVIYGFYPVYEHVEVGAICEDGWISSSTGSGTCSHHGGVDEWIYHKVKVGYHKTNFETYYLQMIIVVGLFFLLTLFNKFFLYYFLSEFVSFIGVFLSVLLIFSIFYFINFHP